MNSDGRIMSFFVGGCSGHGGVSHFFLSMAVLCVLTIVAMPITPDEEASDNILRNLKRGLLSADSILYYSREDMLKDWVKEASDLEYTVVFQVVTSIANLMASQQSLKDEIDSLENTGSYQIELTAITLVVDAVLDDACVWLNDVLKRDEFNCTTDEINRLVSQIRAQKSVEDIKLALKEYKRLKGLGSCNWIECNIWCNEDFQALDNPQKVLKYILKYNDVGCDDFTSDSVTCDMKCAGFENQS